MFKRIRNYSAGRIRISYERVCIDFAGALLILVSVVVACAVLFGAPLVETILGGQISAFGLHLVFWYGIRPTIWKRLPDRIRLQLPKTFAESTSSKTGPRTYRELIALIRG